MREMEIHDYARQLMEAHGPRAIAEAAQKATECEAEGKLELAKDYGVLDSREWKALTGETTGIRRMLCGLRAKVLSKPVVTG